MIALLDVALLQDISRSDPKRRDVTVNSNLPVKTQPKVRFRSPTIFRLTIVRKLTSGRVKYS